jgi:cytochrome b pre-mRNA-processing protein 3
MRVMGEAFYGRAEAYDAALSAQGDDALTAALARNVYTSAPQSESSARRLAHYVRRADANLAGQKREEIARGIVHFPSPTETEGD